ncbi:UNVERIFIED_CONTAM: hypothetical protein Slati_3968400 [Sesamum latifolium]|uniref:DDE Tnp4 domain-containing protein n=1 Tax=Sesamum latifolium TaxID=2727402 RepID=A0AAW2TQ14_9LAMI
MSRNAFGKLCLLLQSEGGLRDTKHVSSTLPSCAYCCVATRFLLLAKPVPVSADSSCARWKWFEGCFGALDGTYIDVVCPEDRARYRTRKGFVSVNVLGVCDRKCVSYMFLPDGKAITIWLIVATAMEKDSYRRTGVLGTLKRMGLWTKFTVK